MSLEDGLERRVNNTLVFPLFGVGAAGFAPIPFTYGGERVPDVVGNVRCTGTWGGAQAHTVGSIPIVGHGGCGRSPAYLPSIQSSASVWYVACAANIRQRRGVVVV